MNKLEVAEEYSWYIINALMFRIKKLEDAVEEAQQAIEPTTPKILKVSMEGTIAHCEELIKEHKKALAALKEAGFK